MHYAVTYHCKQFGCTYIKFSFTVFLMFEQVMMYVLSLKKDTYMSPLRGSMKKNVVLISAISLLTIQYKENLKKGKK